MHAGDDDGKLVGEPMQNFLNGHINSYIQSTSQLGHSAFGSVLILIVLYRVTMQHLQHPFTHNTPYYRLPTWEKRLLRLMRTCRRNFSLIYVVFTLSCF